MRRATHIAALVVVALPLTASCSGPTDSSSGRSSQITLTSLELSAPQSALRPDASVALQLTGHYSDNSTKSLTDSATWASANPTIVTVSDASGSKGHAVAVGAGTATVSASYGGKSGTVTLTALGITGLTVMPTTASVDVGNSMQLSAQATLSDGSSAPVTTQAAWRSSDPATVAVSNDSSTRGRVTGVRSGAATISASWHGATGSGTVQSVGVTSIVIGVPGYSGSATGPFPIGTTLTLSATANLSNGSSRPVTDVATWSSSTAAMTVSNASGSRGLVTRTGEDSSYLSATYQGASGTLLVRKACVALASGLTFDGSHGLGVGYLRLDGANVVWFDYDPGPGAAAGAFRTVPTNGGSVRAVATGIPYVGQWALDAGYLYWMFVRTSDDQTYKIVRLNRATGVVDTLFNNGGIGGGARGIAVDANYLYYSPGDFGGIRRVPKAGGGATAFFSGSSFSPLWISLDAGTVYGVDTYPERDTVRVRRVPTTGVKMDTLAAKANGSPYFINSFYATLAGGYLYWSGATVPGPVLRVPVSGGAVQTVLASRASDGFAIVDDYVYSVQNPQGNPGAGLYRQPVAGGAPQLVTDACGSSRSAPMHPRYLTTDGAYLYLSDVGTSAPGLGAILRVKK